jgi:tRNA modification GTPase
MRISGDTIAAIATPPGAGGIAVVRLSGPEAVGIAARIVRRGRRVAEARSHSVVPAWVVDADGSPLDEVLVTVMLAPHTYTREDVVEIGVHGGSVPARRVLRAALAAGARLADRGEFTKRAFVHGRIDLSRAEAVADLVAARTDRGADAALVGLAGGIARRTGSVESRVLDLLARLEVNLDFNEDVSAVSREEIVATLDACREELRELESRAPWGRRLREGARVVLVGPPNVGKSSLFNALLEDERALVSETPGTTRDYLDASLDLDGMPVLLVDTAGQREATESLEAEGVRRSREREAEADLVLRVVDLAANGATADGDKRTIGSVELVVGNKQDLIDTNDRVNDRVDLRVSARTGEGLAELRTEIGRLLWEGAGPEPEDGVLPNERHVEALRRARASLDLARRSWEDGATEELIAGDVRDAAEALGEITGKTVGEEVLDRIFRKFCIGK